MWGAAEHLMRGARPIQRKHGPHIRDQRSALEHFRERVQPGCGHFHNEICGSYAVPSLRFLGNRRHDRNENAARLQNTKRPLRVAPPTVSITTSTGVNDSSNRAAR